MHCYRLCLRCISAIALVCASSSVPAQSPPPPPLTPPLPLPAWETVASAGLTLTKGNSDTMLAHFGVTSGKKWDQNEIGLGTSLSYGETSGQKSVDNLGCFAQYNRLFSERFYGGLKVTAVQDDIADLDYRVTISPLTGYYLVKEPRTRLSGEIGPSYVIEQLGGVNSSYAGLRLGERLEHKFNERAKLWQSADFMPQVDMFSKYLVTFELGLDTAITEQVTLRTVLRDNFDSIPAQGRKENDLRLITGLTYKF